MLEASKERNPNNPDRWADPICWKKKCPNSSAMYQGLGAWYGFIDLLYNASEAGGDLVSQTMRLAGIIEKDENGQDVIKNSADYELLLVYLGYYRALKEAKKAQNTAF